MTSAILVLPGLASAHGPANPIATSYLARIARVPAGLDAKVVDGDLRMWLRVAPNDRAEVLDYRGAPYLRFSRSGVDVNLNSAMYYLNMVPVVAPPARVSPTIPPRWHHATSGHAYGWHDGRLHALARTALAPGATYVGRWSVPVIVGGRLAAISGGLFYMPPPSIAWFWPIVVLFACVLAGWRLRRPALDQRLARVLAAAALIAVAVAAAGRELHGRPTVSVYQLVLLAIVLTLVAWGLRRALLGTPGWFGDLLIAMVALWAGITLIPTLLHGYVLMSVPAFVARAAAVVCLGSGAGLLLIAIRAAMTPGVVEPIDDPAEHWGYHDDLAELNREASNR